jgi:hypothetical protein
MSAPAAPRCCVIVFEPEPRILWLNGDEGDARRAAAEWCAAHIGEPAHIMVLDDTLRAEILVKGSKA